MIRRSWGAAYAYAITPHLLNLGWNYLGEGFGEIVLDLLKKNTSLTSLGIDSDIDYYSDIQGILSEREPLIEGPSVKVAPSILVR